MKSFLTAFLGSLSAIVLVLALTLGIGSCVAGKKSPIEDGSYLVIELNGELLEYDPPGNLMNEIAGEDVETLQRVLDNLRKAEVDDRIAGVIVKVSFGARVGAASTQEIRAAIKRFRESGKKVIGWGESFGLRDYFLLSACDSIYAPPTAYVGFKGLSASAVHVKKMLDKIGVKADLHKIREYKSAAELVTRESSSEPARENVEWMLDEFWTLGMQMLREDRGLEEAQVTALMQRAWLSAREALEGGLLDGIKYWDEVEASLKGDGDAKLAKVTQHRYAQVDPAKLGLEGDRTIAVIHAQGTIVGRESGVNPLLGLTMGHETIVGELRRAREDDDVAAIVFRVDSPGGDALDSDLMGHEVELTAAVKPVVVSMVDVAASGGYDIAYRASRLLADPMTVTGSIGSISGKFNLAGLYDKLGITWTLFSRGPMALADSDLADFTPEERARFEENHWEAFNRWLADVADHRGMSVEQAQKLAYGRVWSGRQAETNGLVDELGDLHRAIELAKELAGIEAGEKVTIAHYPERKGLLATLLGGGDDLTQAARWMVYRSLRREAAETMRIVASRPDAVLEGLTR